MYIYPIIAILVGLAIGSFLNVIIFRIDDLKSVLYTRSHCPHCKEVLRWYDLIPFLSYVILRGKCRYCKKTISIQYPIVEVGIALLFLVLYYIFGLGWQFAFYAILFSILTVVFVYDFKTELIPEEFVWTGLVIALLGSWYFGNFGLSNMLIGSLICGAIPLILVLVSREKWMGAGDIKLGFLVGAMVGYPRAMFLIFAAFVLGSIVGVIYLATKKKQMKDSLPFAPFLIASALIALIWGQYFIDWYFGYFRI
ncbi:MAG: prepilin peptidase [Patescibacteria group bacterium]